MMKKLNKNNSLNKNCLFFLSHCILFFCLQLKLCFAQTNNFDKEVSSNNINTEINTAEIPLSYDTGSGRIFDLRNMIDFRRTTVRQANAAATTLSNAKVINTSNTRMRHNSSASIQGLMIPVNNTTFSADVEDFLPRVDSVFLTKDGELIIKKGASSRSPIAPPAISGAMLINTIRVNPFPSLSLPAARKFQRFD